MIRPTVLKNAGRTVEYFEGDLGTAQWYGKLVERLGLTQEVTVSQLRSLLNNICPNGERLTARTKKNRRIATEFEFSLEKDKSIYLARTRDPIFEGCVKQAIKEQLDIMQNETRTRVNKGGIYNRTTGEALFAMFTHWTSRAVKGNTPDPHYHCHVVQINATWDSIENRFKATELGSVFKNRKYHQQQFHKRLNDMLMERGYLFRKGANGPELSIIRHEDMRTFSKRTAQIEEIAKERQADLQRKATQIVETAARYGRKLDPYFVWLKLKDKLGEQTRKEKGSSVCAMAHMTAQWSSQLPPGRWDAITVEGARYVPLGPMGPKSITMQHLASRTRQPGLERVAGMER